MLVCIVFILCEVNLISGLYFSSMLVCIVFILYEVNAVSVSFCHFPSRHESFVNQKHVISFSDNIQLA